MARHDEVVRAGVVAGGVDTRYLGAGRGAPVLVLSDDPARRTALLKQLPLGLRVIAPELPPSPHPRVERPDFPAWLGCFLEALGLWRVAMVADAALIVPSVDMALADPERVTSLVLLQRGLPNEGTEADGFDAQIGALPNGIPLLSTWVGAGELSSLERAIPHIAGFLARPRTED